MEKFKTGINVLDAMTTKPITVDFEETMINAVKSMSQHRVGSLLVMQDKEIKGIVTERDLVHKLAKGLSLSDPVNRYMTPKKNMITITPEKDIYDAMLVMTENSVRHLPVLEGKKVVGFITTKDILKIEPQLFELLAEKYELREAERKPLDRWEQ
ncbi:MAG: CBS domain-containing protein [Candidatus Woesearchaeota archaeon]